jgi:hypothetical protein
MSNADAAMSEERMEQIPVPLIRKMDVFDVTPRHYHRV